VSIIRKLWRKILGWLYQLFGYRANSSNDKLKPFATIDEGGIMKEDPEKDRNRSGHALKVNVRVPDRHKGEKLPPARIYLFDKAGQLVATERVDEDYDRATELKAPLDRNYRIVLGPDLLAGHERPADLAAQLTRVRTISQDFRAGTTAEISISAYRSIWWCWWETCILVHGTVRKLTNPGSPTPLYAPICHGTVQIFEVDLECTLHNLASFEVSSIRDYLVDVLRGIPPRIEKSAVISRQVFPDPPPDRIVNRATLTRTRQLTSRSGGASSGAAASHVANSASSAASTQSAAQVTRSASHSELANTLAELHVSNLGRYVSVNKIDLWPYLCGLIPDWAFCWQELGEAPLQSDGTFSSEICFWCPSDFPDLYFEVVQNYDGTEIEIYDPQIACSTYYGYNGSQSVDIIVDDPRAVACPPPYDGPDGLFVHPLGFYETSLASIIDLETDVTFSSPNKGKVPKGAPIGGTINAPWGGTLPLKMDYAQGMLGHYYRLSYRFDSDGGGTAFSSFTPVTTVVDHYYRVWDDITTFTGHWERFNLGPRTVVRPGDGVSVTNLYAFPDKTLDWRFLYDEDIMFAFFDSTGGVTDPASWDRDTADGISAHKGGMVTLLLEVFDSNGNFVPCNNPVGTANWGDPTGGEVTPAPPAFEFLLPPLGGPPEGFAPAPTANITDHGRMIFRILVNNNYTVAKLNDVTNGGTPATPCGFLNFDSPTDSISIGYVARHAQDYLDSSMSVVRGFCGQADSQQRHGSTPGAASPPGPEAQHANPASFLLRSLSPPASCGACPDGAAFAVNLYTYAWATDGRNRKSQYDDSDTIAFALLKPCPIC